MHWRGFDARLNPWPHVHSELLMHMLPMASNVWDASRMYVIDTFFRLALKHRTASLLVLCRGDSNPPYCQAPE